MNRRMPAAAGGILSYFTRHRTVANLILVVMLLAGAVSVPNMRTQFFPDTTPSTITVSVAWDEAGAEDIDRGIIELLQPVVLAVEGVDYTSATASEGSATIRISFEPGRDLDQAMSDVESAVDTVTGLPAGADDPQVRFNTSWDRVTNVVITGPVGSEQLVQYADAFRARLFEAGVTRTSIGGVATPQILVEVPSVRLIGNDISMDEIAGAIGAEVAGNPAGSVDGAGARVRAGSEKRTAAEIAEIVLRSEPGGRQLLVGDVATVTRLGPDRRQSYFVGDNPAVMVQVDRSPGGDAIGIQATVEQVAAQLQATLPAGVTIELRNTSSEAISARLSTLIDNGLTGLALVVGLLFLFLNARSAFWVAAGIPVAMMAAISIMYLAGLSLNMVSLFGLIITLGIVVDDAIVVAEHADYRARHLGEPPVVAAENAARRMAMPVFAATLTTVIAFSGLTLIGGWYGTIIRDIPLTVIAVVIASLVECFLVLPNHMAHALAAKAKERWYDWPSRQVNRGFRVVRDRAFRPLMAGVVAARYVVLAGVLAILASQVAVFIRGDVQWRFFDSPERGTIRGNFMMAETASRDDALLMMHEMQRATETLRARYIERYGRDPVDNVTAQVGGTFGRGLSGAEDRDKDLQGGISIELIDADARDFTSSAFVSDLQELVVPHPLAEVIAFRGARRGPQSDAISVRLSGAGAAVLKAASLEMQSELSDFTEVSALQDSLAYDLDELLLDLTPQGLALGFTTDQLGRDLRNRLAGIEAATFPDGQRSTEIRVELPENELTADFLAGTLMRTPDGGYVPLADIVTVERRAGFRSVRRTNGVREITVTGDVSEDDPARAAEITQYLRDDLMPRIAGIHQVDYEIAGLAEDESRFLSDAGSGMVLCLAGIYAALAWVFGSWSRPVIVMAIIPFGLVGTIYGHAVWEVPLSMFTVVGLLGMSGIIINDSIVLITTIDDYAEDRGLIPSIIDGATDRLRPVMLTTLTTVLGMTPLLYETSRQAQFLKPTVITLVYGLGFGMILVLLVVPALIAVQHDISRQIRAMRRGLGAPVRRIRMSFLALWGVVLAWGGATLGWTIATGSMMPGMRSLVPVGTGDTSVTGALMVFVAGAAVIAALGYAAGALMLRASGGARAQPGVQP